MIASLIICHKNPLQVIRLAKRLHSSYCDVYIHVDINMVNDEFLIIEDFVSSENGIYLTTTRLHGELDKRSMIDITMVLLQDAINNELCRGRYIYFLLFSGQDYPIKPMKWVEEQLEASYPKPFIDCTPYSEENWIYHKFTKNKFLVSYNTWISHNFRKGIFRYGLRVSALLIEKICIVFGLTARKKLDRLHIDLYGGSAWWILPDVMIKFIYDEYKNNHEYINVLLDSTRTPEDTFFQTVAMRSPMRNDIVVNPSEMRAQNCNISVGSNQPNSVRLNQPISVKSNQPTSGCLI